MVKVRFIEVTKSNEHICYSCNKKIKNEEKFNLEIGNLNFNLCVDCGNDLINKMHRAWEN